MEATISTAQTGRLGDKKSFITDLEQTVRVRNRENMQRRSVITVALHDHRGVWIKNKP